MACASVLFGLNELILLSDLPRYGRDLDIVERMSYGPVMILTGGSRGIGAATARLAAGRGHAVCVNYLSGREAAEDVVKEITTGGGRAEAMQADVSVEAEVESLRGGANVNVSSGAAKYGSPGEYDDYAASKGAVETFTVGLAKEVAEAGIRVNAVRPGIIYTDFHAKGGEADRVDRVKSLVPMQRGGTAEEVAHAILWLLSAEASYTTGSVLDVAGGR